MILPQTEKSACEVGSQELEAVSASRNGPLTDPHCRQALECLREQDGSASVSAVATYVVSELTEEAPEDVSENVQRRVQTWLHHGQLPRLDERGLVEFEPESGTVRLVDPSVCPEPNNAPSDSGTVDDLLRY